MAFDAHAFYGAPVGEDREISPTIEVRQGRVHLRLSASQIEVFAGSLDGTRDGCERKWAWRYVALVEDPPGPGAVLGKTVHTELERYLGGGNFDFTTEAGYIAASGVQHLPKPGTPGMVLEGEFHFFGPSGHSYLGYKDVEVAPSPGVLGLVLDHKTTSDFRWQKTEDDLRSDPQAILYAVDFFREHPSENEVELRWTYYLTRKSRRSAVTRAVINQRDTWNQFQKIEKIAERMSVAALKQPLELPANVNHCSAYGGCPHQGRCNLSPFDKMRSHMEQNKLLAKLGKTNGAPPPAAGVPAPAAAPLSNPLLSKLRGMGAPLATPVAAQPAAINPPGEWQPPPAPPAPAAPEDPLAGRIAPGQAIANPYMHMPGGVAPSPAAGSGAVSPPAPAAAPAAPATRGRGRPKKADVVAAQQQVLAGQANPYANPMPAAPAQPTPAGSVPVQSGIGTLYINCTPIGVEVVDATTYILAGKKLLLDQHGLADYRFAEYGQGPGMLAIATASAFDALGICPEHVRLDTSSPEGQAVVTDLIARASLVVRA